MKKGKGKGKKKEVLKCEECGSTQVRLVEDEEGSWKPGEEPFWVCCECGAEVFEA